jgi:hypothetical protein
MGPNARTPEPPKSTGWYVAWRAEGGAYAKPDVHFCTELDGRHDIGCMEECGSPSFRSVRDPFFAGALWHGPFESRRQAQDAASSAA